MFCAGSDDGKYSGKYYGVKILLCHTTRTSLSTTFEDNYSGNTPAQVLSLGSLVLNWTQNSWNQIGFDSPFSYNGVDNLLIEIRWDNAEGSLVTGVEYPVPDQVLRGYSVDATSGSLQYYRNVLQLWYSPVTAPHIDLMTMDHGTNVVLRWSSVPGQLYSVSSRADLQSGSWSNLNILPYVGAYGGQNQCTVGVDRTRSEMFFRVTTP